MGKKVDLFSKLGGKLIGGYPVIDAKVYQTLNSTLYLKIPGVALISRPQVNVGGMAGFFQGFAKSLDFTDYMTDPVNLPAAEALCKIAGQTCYASFGPKRTFNSDAQKYFENLIFSGHGSVLEHANFSFLIYGVSRSLTHELVRHRAGFGYSQLSQRYVSGKVLRFVERPEYQEDKHLHQLFEARIDRAAKEYDLVAKHLLSEQEKGRPGILSADSKTDLRKKVNQTARSVLPNETETWVVTTGNVRAWRHVVSMRASEHAETEIRELAYRLFLCLREEAPILFSDFEVVSYSDGTKGVKTSYPKV